MTRIVPLLAALACSTLLSMSAAAQDGSGTRVRFETTMGDFVVQLETDRAPLTTGQFLKFVREGYYAGTVFHRVINNFVAQAGTLGLARTNDPHSGGAQFYINLVDNPALDPQASRWGYAVFGRVVQGMDVVDKIGHVATGARGDLRQDAPLEPIVIKKTEVLP